MPSPEAICQFGYFWQFYLYHYFWPLENAGQNLTQGNTGCDAKGNPKRQIAFEDGHEPILKNNWPRQQQGAGRAEAFCLMGGKNGSRRRLPRFSFEADFFEKRRSGYSEQPGMARARLKGTI